MNCPRCATTLQRRVLDGLEIDTCPRCNGVWLDPGEGEPLTRPGAAIPRDLVQRAASDRLRAISGELAPCPKCGTPMVRERFDKSLVNIDRCRCGVWLDGGEADKIQAYREKRLRELEARHGERVDEERFEVAFARMYFDLGRR